MLNIPFGRVRFCDGVSRRNFLKVGTFSFGAASLTLADILRAEAAANGKQDLPRTRHKALINIFLGGGPPHQDMWEIKTEAPAEIRGEFKPISTNVPGIQIGELLPLQAKMFDKLSVVRSAYHTNAGHGMGLQWMQTGYHATIEVNDNIYPSTGSVVANLKGANDPGLPAYVNLPRKVPFGNAAYLGASVERPKLVAFATATLLTAASVSVSGTIGFVGLVVPHAIRLVWGSDNRGLLPCAALAGAAFLVAADTLARSLAGANELPIGIVTALVGVPCFVWLLRRPSAGVST